MGKKKSTIQAKLFPWAVRQPLWEMAKKHGKQKFTLVAIWDYMFWRSGKGNLFELSEDLVCFDIGCDATTLRKARSILVAEGWLQKESLRDKGGRWAVRGWTVIPKTKDAQSSSKNDHPPSDLPSVEVSTVATTTDGESPRTVLLQLQGRDAITDNCTITDSEQLASKLVSSVPSVATAPSVTADSASPRLRVGVSCSANVTNPMEAEGAKADQEQVQVPISDLPVYEPLCTMFGGHLPPKSEPSIRTVQSAVQEMGWDISTLEKCFYWTQAHNFWKTRILTIDALAKALSKDISEPDEKTLPAQYRRYLEVLARKPAASIAVKEMIKLKCITCGYPADPNSRDSTVPGKRGMYCSTCNAKPQYRKACLETLVEHGFADADELIKCIDCGKLGQNVEPSSRCAECIKSIEDDNAAETIRRESEKMEEEKQRMERRKERELEIKKQELERETAIKKQNEAREKEREKMIQISSEMEKRKKQAREMELANLMER
jgi:hypothetical protein